MNDAPRTVPYYINEAKSDMRGIKSGWYAIDEDGNLVFGPFDTHDQCVERDIRPTYLMWATPGESPLGMYFRFQSAGSRMVLEHGARRPKDRSAVP
jgi:hypothetical protein